MMSEAVDPPINTEINKLPDHEDNVKQNGDSSAKDEEACDDDETPVKTLNTNTVSDVPTADSVEESHDDEKKELPVEEAAAAPENDGEDQKESEKESQSLEVSKSDSESPKISRKRPSEESLDPDSSSERVGSLEVDNVIIEDGVKRSRKKVERLSDALDKSLAEKEEKPFKIPEGTGVPLGEIEYVSHMIKVTKTDQLKLLHSIVMGRPGTQHQMRGVLRRFRGFECEIGSAEYKKRVARLSGRKIVDIKMTAEVLGLEKKGNRDEIAQRVIDFLVKPKDLGVQIKQKAKKKKKATPSKKKSSDSKGKAASKSSKASKKKKSESSDEESKDDSDSSAKKSSKPRKDAKGSSKSKKSGTKRKAKPKKAKEEEVSDLSSLESEDDEPDAKKTKKMPTDEELKKTVLGLLANVDLEKVTMKNVLQQIYDKYEGLDLTHKKEYLKSVVKDILSN